MTRPARHVCGAAPCLGVADVAGSVIGHAGDVACAQTKTSAQRSREQSHTIRTEIKRAVTHTATGECPRSRQGQPRQGQHAYGGVHARAPVLTSMCKRESTHPRRIPRRGAPWSRSLLRWDQGGAHRGAGKRPVSHAQHASGGSVSPGETNTRKVDPSHGTQAGQVWRGAHRRGSPPHPGRPRHPRRRCRTAWSLRYASVSGLSAAVICPRQRRGLRSAAVARPRRQPCHRGRQAHEHREQPPSARRCAAPCGAPSAGGQACPQKRRSPQPAKRAIRIANIAVWIARYRYRDKFFPNPG